MPAKLIEALTCISTVYNVDTKVLARDIIARFVKAELKTIIAIDANKDKLTQAVEMANAFEEKEAA